MVKFKTLATVAVAAALAYLSLDGYWLGWDAGFNGPHLFARPYNSHEPAMDALAETLTPVLGSHCTERLILGRWAHGWPMHCYQRDTEVSPSNSAESLGGLTSSWPFDAATVHYVSMPWIFGNALINGLLLVCFFKSAPASVEIRLSFSLRTMIFATTIIAFAVSTNTLGIRLVWHAVALAAVGFLFERLC